MAIQQIISQRQAREMARTDGRIEVLETTEQQLSTRGEFSQAIAAAWQGIEKRYLLIGRYLLQAKQKLDHGDYLDMIERDLPFNRNNAYRMREVAESIDRGRVAETELPRSYSVIYEVVTLSDTELSTARKRGLIRPDLRRHEIVSFKREMRTPVEEHRIALLKRREQILVQQTRLAEELRRIDDQLGGPVIDLAAEDGTDGEGQATGLPAA